MNELEFLTLEFGIKISRSEVPTELLSFHIDICLSNGSTFDGPSKHIDLSLCRPNVLSLSSMLAQQKKTLDRRFVFAGITTVILIL